MGFAYLLPVFYIGDKNAGAHDVLKAGSGLFQRNFYVFYCLNCLGIGVTYPNYGAVFACGSGARDSNEIAYFDRARVPYHCFPGRSAGDIYACAFVHCVVLKEVTASVIDLA